MRCRQIVTMAFNDAILSRVQRRVKQSGQGLLSFGRNCGENATVAECQPRLGNAEAERIMNDVFPSPPKRDFPMLERSKRRIRKIWSLRTRSGVQGNRIWVLRPLCCRHSRLRACEGIGFFDRERFFCSSGDPW